MLRILLLTLVAAAVLPSAAHAAVFSNVSGDTLAVTGDGGADPITLRLVSPRILQVNGSPFNRTTSAASRCARGPARTGSGSTSPAASSPTPRTRRSRPARER